MEFEKLLGQLYTNDGEKKTASAMAPFTGEIDVEMLDYPYIGKCNDPAELEAILELLKYVNSKSFNQFLSSLTCDTQVGKRGLLPSSGRIRIR